MDTRNIHILTTSIQVVGEDLDPMGHHTMLCRRQSDGEPLTGEGYGGLKSMLDGMMAGGGALV